MEKFLETLKRHIAEHPPNFAHPFDSGDSECETVLDQLYQAYAESHESDPQEISGARNRRISSKPCPWTTTMLTFSLLPPTRQKPSDTAWFIWRI